MIEIAYHERVAETLRAVAGYPVPVARSCHLGNNGAYNWGWLALARNTRPVLYDHTTYGADRLCLPWTVLGDGGRVDAAYDIDGGEVASLAGAHATEAAGAAATRHRSILNYGIPARHGGRPLAQHHHAANRELARHFNGSRPSFDALVILENLTLFREALAAAHRRGVLHLMIDRWVHTAGGRVILSPIGAIRRRGEDLSVGDRGERPLFAGTIEDLIQRTRASLTALRAHVEDGAPLGRPDHPWPSLPMSYLFGAAVESARCPELRVFLHAGGLTSPYYMLEPDFRSRFAAVHGHLADAGLLPRSLRFVVVPIGCCQLFATASPEPLDDLVAGWLTAVRSLPDHRRVMDHLAGRRRPFGPELARATRELDRPVLRRLRRQLDRLGADEANRLPICFAADAPGPRFNKYGAGARALLGATPRFPPALAGLTWLEGEWLTQVLALLCADEAEPAPDYAAFRTTSSG